MLSRQQQPQPRGDDRERVIRARQAAEALFTSKPPVSGPSVPDSPSADQTARKPRVLRIISPAAPVRLEKIEAPVSPQTKRKIPPSQFARIRALLKYGMTVSQVAEVYGAAAGDIERAFSSKPNCDSAFRAASVPPARPAHVKIGQQYRR